MAKAALDLLQPAIPPPPSSLQLKENLVTTKNAAGGHHFNHEPNEIKLSTLRFNTAIESTGMQVKVLCFYNKEFGNAPQPSSQMITFHKAGAEIGFCVYWHDATSPFAKLERLHLLDWAKYAEDVLQILGSFFRSKDVSNVSDNLAHECYVSQTGRTFKHIRSIVKYFLGVRGGMLITL